MKAFHYLIFAGVSALAGVAHAADVRMANGSVSFSVPDRWVSIMEATGDPEVRVFQVPDPSPTAGTSLARVSVVIKQVAGADDFKQYVDSAIAKARSMIGYQPGIHQSNDDFTYTAKESGELFNYTERYWLKGNHAIQLRCARPTQSQAGAAWAADFDKGCDAVAARLK